MSNLSDVFKYISHFRHAGHQVGRKVGDMLEVLTYAAIVRENELHSRLQVEPKLVGFSDAGHKVEFTILKKQTLNAKQEPVIKNGGTISNPENILAFIECKKVGVEQTVNTKFKKTFKKHNNKSYKIPYNIPFNISFAPRGTEVRHTYTIEFEKPNWIKIVKKEDSNFKFREEITSDSRIIFALTKDYESIVIGNSQSLRDVIASLDNCRVLEILATNENEVIALLNDCLAGPQTPEKAKQSSFVALDVRKKRFNSCDKRNNEEEMISVLVLTEFSHWELKSQKMIKAFIDKNFIVQDSLIIEAFMKFEEKFGSNFYEKIAKEKFEKDSEVRALAIEIVEKYEGKIFLDLDDKKTKSFTFENGQLKFSH
jgi:hypothetical protein